MLTVTVLEVPLLSKPLAAVFSSAADVASAMVPP